MLPEDPAEGMGDLTRREGAGGDLVEQRLEGVVVAPVDERQVDPVVLAEPPGRVQAAEAATDDRDAVASARSLVRGSGSRLHGPIVGQRTRVGAPGAQVWTFAWFVS